MKNYSTEMLALAVMIASAALVVATGIDRPIVDAAVKASPGEWLGFAGSIVGGAMTLVAGYMAWRGIKNQIDIQRDATLIQSLIADRDDMKSQLPGLRNAIEMSARIYDSVKDTPANAGDILPAIYQNVCGISVLSEQNFREAANGAHDDVRWKFGAILNAMNKALISYQLALSSRETYWNGETLEHRPGTIDRCRMDAQAKVFALYAFIDEMTRVHSAFQMRILEIDVELSKIRERARTK